LAGKEMNKWLNKRYRRWRLNKIKHGIKKIISRSYRAENKEYEAWLKQERKETEQLFSEMKDD
jgi:hypothetical protein